MRRLVGSIPLARRRQALWLWLVVLQPIAVVAAVAVPAWGEHFWPGPDALWSLAALGGLAAIFGSLSLPGDYMLGCGKWELAHRVTAGVLSVGGALTSWLAVDNLAIARNGATSQCVVTGWESVWRHAGMGTVDEYRYTLDCNAAGIDTVTTGTDSEFPVGTELAVEYDTTGHFSQSVADTHWDWRILTGVIAGAVVVAVLLRLRGTGRFVGEYLSSR